MRPTPYQQSRLDRIISHIMKVVRQESANIRKLCHVCLSASVPQPYGKPLNAVIVARSSEGKTFLATKVCDYFPSMHVEFLKGMSPKSLFYESGTPAILNPKMDAPLEDQYLTEWKGEPVGVLIDRLRRQIEDGVKERLSDEVKKWNSELEYLQDRLFYIVDLRHRILLFLEEPSLPVWSDMLAIMSHDTYWTVSRAVNGDAKKYNRRVVFRGWPAVIFCTSTTKTAYSWRDLQTRFEVIEPTQTSQKYQEAVSQIFHNKFDFAKREDPETESIKEEIRNLWDEINMGGYRVYTPFDPEHIAESFYNIDQGAVMRRAEKLGTHLELETLWHLGQRIVCLTSNDSNEYLLVSPEDVNNIFSMYMSDIDYLASQLGIGPLHMEFYFNVVLTAAEVAESGGKALTTDEIVTQLLTYVGSNKETKLKSSRSTVYHYLKGLEDAHLISKEDIEDREGKKRKGKKQQIAVSHNRGELRALLPNVKGIVHPIVQTDRFDSVTKVKIPPSLACSLMEGSPFVQAEQKVELHTESTPSNDKVDAPESSPTDIPSLLANIYGGRDTVAAIASDIGLDLGLEELSQHVGREKFVTALMHILGYTTDFGADGWTNSNTNERTNDSTNGISKDPQVVAHAVDSNTDTNSEIARTNQNKSLDNDLREKDLPVINGTYFSKESDLNFKPNVNAILKLTQYDTGKVREVRMNHGVNIRLPRSVASKEDGHCGSVVGE